MVNLAPAAFAGVLKLFTRSEPSGGRRSGQYPLRSSPDGQHSFCGPKIERAFRDGRSRQANAAESIGCYYRKLIRGRQDEHLALFSREIKVAAREDGRCAKTLFAATEAF